ncbi:hypothetical protein RAS12_30285 (plasmid) [Achromobacter seleniivolatilans]|uniref:Uncharacterized protein n=1 Tax=Achromobacter seleniivolatilans TaxID=3047478 RepID=A0ABY9MCL6_9BURK|nr:hypothetical protein [Achromobacter sp. R39]WMD23923.1 hypothetical protein RAS12_30285 [Achromobacter sp. R39]
MSTENQRDPTQSDLPAGTATDPRVAQADAWEVVSEAAGTGESGNPSDRDHQDRDDEAHSAGGMHTHDDDEHGPAEDVDEEEDDDEAKKEAKRRRSNLIFGAAVAAFLTIVAVLVYVFLFKPSTSRNAAAPANETTMQHAFVPEIPDRSEPGRVPPPKRAMAPAAPPPVEQRLEDERRSEAAVTRGPESTGRGRGASAYAASEFEEDRRTDHDQMSAAAVSPSRSEARGMEGRAEQVSAGRNLESSMDLVAANVLQLNSQVAMLQGRLVALEAGQQAILKGVTAIGEKATEKPQATTSSAKAPPARGGDASKAKPTAQASSANRVSSGSTPKVGKLAGLWVKGAYPTTGGETQIAWVMTEDNKLEAAVRVGSVVRGAKVTAFDGMKVVTTAGTIHPR